MATSRPTTSVTHGKIARNPPSGFKCSFFYACVGVSSPSSRDKRTEGAEMPSTIPLPSDDQLRDDVRDALGNLPPLNIFRMLATLPSSFRPFLELGGSLLGDPELDPRIREIAILRVAHVTRAPYEWAQHVQLGRNVGLGDAEIEAVRSEDPGRELGTEGALVCRAVDEISRDVRLSDEALELLLGRYGVRRACSLILCASYYNMVSRFLESTRVEIEPEELLAQETPGAIVERGRSARRRDPSAASADLSPEAGHADGRLHGRRLLVVGGGTAPSADSDAPIGNGRAICVLAAREGAAVAVADIDEDAAGETVGLIERGDGTAVSVVGDAADPAQAERLVEEAAGELGGLDAVVLNVGITGGVGLEGTTSEDWERVLSVNVQAHFEVVKHALPRMEGGAIVFISSLAGFRPGSFCPAYDASKAALLGLCRHVATEGAPRKVRANVVAPGLIDTPLGRHASRMNPARERVRIPLGRQGTAWEIAHPTVFLLSDEASYITGQALIVDGGVGDLVAIR
jgi:NAD(P)-dependent dehydrogenase (short-subunit alcohol dehydrogenase family)